MKNKILFSLLLTAFASSAQVISSDTTRNDTTVIKKRVLQRSASTSASTSGDFAEAVKSYAPKNIQSSPEASAFQAISHTPVGHFTGKANISFPVGTAEGKSISLPVSIAYDASGIKVEQEATQVGLGWSLNAGGMITRQVNARDDFDGILRDNLSTQTTLNTYLEDSYVIAQAPNNTGNVTWQVGNYSGIYPIVTLSLFCSNPANLPFYNTAKSLVPSNNLLNVTESGTPVLDGSYDVFSYQAGSYSGKFIITRQVVPYKILTLGYEPCKIELLDLTGSVSSNPDMTGKSGFKITTPDGMQYFYTVIEETKTRGAVSNTGKYYIPEFNSYLVAGQSRPLIDINWDFASVTYAKPIISSWQLTKIVAASNPDDVITLNYEIDSDFSAHALLNRSENLTFQNHNWRLSHTAQKNVLLTSITGSKSSIFFDRSLRTDVRGNLAKKLDKIRITDAALNPIKAYNFSYSYFNNTASPDPVYVKTRLRLDSFREEGIDGTMLPPHTFLYTNTVNGISKDLPSKGSYAQDFWGYYNGADGNDAIDNVIFGSPSSIDPDMKGTLIPVSIPHTNWQFANASNRSVNADYMRLGTLSEITYPTKGSMILELEPNTFDNYTVAATPLSIKVSNIVSNPVTRQGPGLRVKSTKMVFDNLNLSKYLSKKYDYNFENGKTSGRLMFDASFSYIISNGTSNPYQVFSSGTKAPMSYSANGSPIGYRFVRESDFDSDNNQNNGVVEHLFNIQVDKRYDKFCFSILAPVQTCASTLPYFGEDCDVFEPIFDGAGIFYNKTILDNPAVPNKVSPYNGLIESKTIRNRNLETVLTETYTYSPENETNRVRVKALSATGRVGIYENYPALFTYYHDLEWVKLLSKTTESYLPSATQKTVTIENYQYNSNNQEVNQVENINSKGEVIRTSVVFPDDVKNTLPIAQVMVNKNMLVTPISNTTFNFSKNKELSKQIFTYKDFGTDGSRILLEKTKKYIQGFDDGIQDAILSYDDDSNLNQVLSRAEPVGCYLWAYNGNYAIAKINNATLAQVETALAGLSVSSSYLALRNSSDNIYIENTLNALRLALPNAYITSYLHQPMVGMLKTTSPNNISMFYNYDTFNRLIDIKDTNGKLIKSNTYNYKQPQP